MIDDTMFDLSGSLSLGRAPAITMDKPGWRARGELFFQTLVGWLTLLPFAGFLVFLMKYFGRYRIENLAEVRAEYRRCIRDGRPLVVCANHLTCIDSAIILWALASNFWYLRHYRYFAWNLPAGDFFKKNWAYRFTAFLTKCIFVHRDGSKVHKDGVLARCQYLLERGEVIFIFPEGRRSRIGRFDIDHLTYGVGKLLCAVPGAKVLCVYSRGDRQQGYSFAPPGKSKFHISLKIVEPRSIKFGREAYAENTTQIAQTLFQMETDYFAARAAEIFSEARL